MVVGLRNKTSICQAMSISVCDNIQRDSLSYDFMKIDQKRKKEVKKERKKERLFSNSTEFIEH